MNTKFNMTKPHTEFFRHSIDIKNHEKLNDCQNFTNFEKKVHSLVDSNVSPFRGVIQVRAYTLLSCS